MTASIVPAVEPKAIANVRKALEIETFTHIYLTSVGAKTRVMCMRVGYDDEAFFTVDSAHEYSILLQVLKEFHYEIRPNFARPGVVAEPARSH